MRANDIRGSHPCWQQYLNGPTDRAALQKVPGIGPQRSALLLRLYGSIDGFLRADPQDVAVQSRGLIGARLAARLQARCIEAALRSDWTPLKEANRAARPDERTIADRVRALFVDDIPHGHLAGLRAAGRRWTLAHLARAWAFTAPWAWDDARPGAPPVRPPGP